MHLIRMQHNINATQTEIVLAFVVVMVRLKDPAIQNHRAKLSMIEIKSKINSIKNYILFV